jgi:hypothetical protein
MMRFILSLIFGWLMLQCYLHQPRYNRAFAVLAALFFGLTGVAARGGVIPRIFQNPAGDALGRAIVVGEEPPPPKGLRRRRA